MNTAAAFEAYRERYAVRAPDLNRQIFADEVRLLSAEEGLEQLRPAPAQNPKIGTPPSLSASTGANKYLWVVARNDVPIALEELKPGVTLQRGRLAHTNLTGGQSAHCGGELWFLDDSTVILNGGSGRYPPQSSTELMDVAEGFKQAGYRSASMGWDTERNLPHRTLRGEPEWI